MTPIERAREAVIEAWLDVGFSPVAYGASFDDVRAGKWDNKTTLRIALTAYEMGRDDTRRT